ncbi:hypothetical protein [Ensifer aridi]|uniref:hypothetical protein n=1 Tax=Ensifer aridi TaxID=1708715 RepID=UPI000A12223C|nr:hypothetical protein [Ensifer aridi]
MTIKLEAAYHEAGHVVVALVSSYHNVVSGIDLYQYGAGAADVSVSGSKCKAAGKPADESIRKDKDVARGTATILMAGYQAEQIAASLNEDLKPNRRCADPDYELALQVLQEAGLAKKTDHAERDAKAILQANWPVIEKIAQAAFSKGSLSFTELYDILDP